MGFFHLNGPLGGVNRLRHVSIVVKSLTIEAELHSFIHLYWWSSLTQDLEGSLVGFLVFIESHYCRMWVLGFGTVSGSIVPRDIASLTEIYK